MAPGALGAMLRKHRGWGFPLGLVAVGVGSGLGPVRRWGEGRPGGKASAEVGWGWGAHLSGRGHRSPRAPALSLTLLGPLSFLVKPLVHLQAGNFE